MARVRPAKRIDVKATKRKGQMKEKLFHKGGFEARIHCIGKNTRRTFKTSQLEFPSSYGQCIPLNFLILDL